MMNTEGGDNNMTDTTTTTDFGQFGYLERQKAEALLHAWNEGGLPEDFDFEEVTIMMNKNSGNVFLVNSEYQVAVLEDEKLVIFYSCPVCGYEGTQSEAQEEGKDFENNNGFCSQDCEGENEGK